MEDPDLIRRVHVAYLQAGADVIATASYQATVDGFVARGLSKQAAADLLRLSVRLAMEAREEFWSHRPNRRGRVRPLVAVSIGPYGAFLANGSEYTGEYEIAEDALVEFHRRRMDVLAGMDADLFAFETIPCLAEGRAIVRLLGEFSRTPAWIAFSCRNGAHVSHGERLAECVTLADQSDIVAAVGVNCTHPRFIESLIGEAAQATSKPIVVYPNSGEGWDSRTRRWTASPDDARLGEWAVRWRRAGASLIGGCCRTTPDDIAEIRAAMLAYR